MRRNTNHSQKKTICIFISFALLFLILSGCGHNNQVLDPSQVGRFRPVPAVNVILDTLGVENEEPPEWEGAEEPMPEDARVIERDYTFGPGDIVRISIFELVVDNTPYVNDYIINETGKINVPEVGVVQVAGLTEIQLEEELRNILQPNKLKEPIVSVTLLSSQKLVFSISGAGVARPGRYNITRHNFRLLDAIATAGGIGQFNISNVYIARQVQEEKPIELPVDSEIYQPMENEPDSGGQDLLQLLSPRSQDESAEDTRYMMSSSEMVTDEELSAQRGTSELDILSELAGLGGGGDGGESGKIEWIFEDGKWTPVQVGGVPTRPVIDIAPPTESKTGELGWEAEDEEIPESRLIKIPSDKLVTGDPQYNIVVRENDRIYIPVDMIGEFCIMGNVVQPSFYPLTGRPLTLKMAIAAAGGLGPLAWPKHCEITRRIGKDREETVMVNLDKIYKGEQPDFYIKPHDLINIGTHPTAYMRFQLRNAFRATYGFGFVYDRNFGNREFGLRHPLGPFN